MQDNLCLPGAPSKGDLVIKMYQDLSLSSDLFPKGLKSIDVPVY